MRLEVATNKQQMHTWRARQWEKVRNRIQKNGMLGNGKTYNRIRNRTRENVGDAFDKIKRISPYANEFECKTWESNHK